MKIIPEGLLTNAALDFERLLGSCPVSKGMLFSLWECRWVMEKKVNASKLRNGNTSALLDCQNGMWLGIKGS